MSLRAIVCVALATLAVACETEAGGSAFPRTDAGADHHQSIERNIRTGTVEDAVFACDLAHMRLADSRNNDEIEDWLDMIDACNLAAQGDLQAALAELP